MRSVLKRSALWVEQSVKSTPEPGVPALEPVTPLTGIKKEGIRGHHRSAVHLFNKLISFI